jgi:transposase-like protein
MEKSKYICQKCNKTFTRKANLNMHELTCEGEVKKKEKKIDIIDKLSINCEKGIHDLVMLNPHVISQKRAIINGFSAVCKKCGELV